MEIAISKWQKSFNFPKFPSCVVHVGAHLCEERDLYAKSKFEKVYWIEGNLDLVKKSNSLLKMYPNQIVQNFLVGEKRESSVNFYIASNDGLSSSILKSRLHATFQKSVKFDRKEKIKTVTIPDLFEVNHLEYLDLLVLDIQGMELAALKGAESVLKLINYIFVEVSFVRLYKNQGLFIEIINFLNAHGFSLLTHDLGLNSPFGDALFGKTKLGEVYNCKFPNKFLRGMIRFKYNRFFVNTRRLTHKLFYK